MKPCSGRRVVFLLLHFSLPNRRPVFPPIQYGPNTFPRRCVYFVDPTKPPVCISWSMGKTNVWMRKGTSIKNGHTQIRKPALVSYSNVFVYGCVLAVCSSHHHLRASNKTKGEETTFLSPQHPTCWALLIYFVH